MIMPCLFAALLAVAQGDGAPPTAKADLPAPADLFALYRDNFRKFKTLTVQWRRGQSYTDAWRARDAKQLEAMSKAADAAETAGSADVHQLRQQLNARRQVQGSYAALTLSDQLYSTDRSRYLMKLPPAGWEIGRAGDPPPIPETPIDEQALKTTYSGYQLYAYPAPQGQGVLQISGNGPGGYVSAMIRRQLYLDNRNYFPPLGAENTAWGEHNHDPIDQFFREDPKDFRSLRRETIGGRETVLIERRRDVMTGAQTRQVDVVRAWIDPGQGGLPLRIEWDYEPYIDGKPLPPDPNRIAYRRLEVEEVLAIKGAGFYPAKGKISTFDADPEAAKPDISTPRVLMEQTTWQASTVRANEPLPASLTAIPIPNGTYYFDETLGMSLKAGYEGGHEARLPWALCGLIVAGWGVYGLVALIRRRGVSNRSADGKPGLQAHNYHATLSS